MKPEAFQAPQFGRVTKKPGDKWAFWYFEPAPVPRELVMEPKTILALSKADAALGRLSGVGRLLRDPSILVHPYLTREAVASSRIEGTEASLSDVLKAEAADDIPENDDIEEVINYQRALREGMKLLEKLPISRRFVREVHKVLLSGVRGQEKLPGEYRKTPVWIGSPTDSPDTATFVPPLPDLLDDVLSDWEKFINEEASLPILAVCALMHYQFETIHPFLDGNGRIGRLLIILLLMEQKVLELPLLYVSAYMEDNRREYYDRLQAVRERGEIQEWMQFFFTAVYRQAVDAEERAGRLVELREKYREQLRGTKSRAAEVVDLFFSNPFITVKRVQGALSVTNQGARNLIDSLEEKGILRKVGTVGRGGRIYWVAEQVHDAIS
ncbi:Fic family protein [Saccharothrix violaceirubra]|uniref:Fic family protein n=1 Tax=Saccharothrix violaceirubra TaxID=413306 RepID=A0A7W7TAD0_9PSEU|nr:Fic family protein [Saccharothrix violaceirubra]MBB4968982.1 Fic family protein [Saccharothrix violaceirubra]